MCATDSYVPDTFYSRRLVETLFIMKLTVEKFLHHFRNAKRDMGDVPRLYQIDLCSGIDRGSTPSASV